MTDGNEFDVLMRWDEGRGVHVSRYGFNERRTRAVLYCTNIFPTHIIDR